MDGDHQQKEKYTKLLLERYGMEGYNQTYPPGVAKEFLPDQLEEKVLSKEAGSVSRPPRATYCMCLGKVSLHTIQHAVTQTAEGCVQTGVSLHVHRQAPGSPPGRDKGLCHHVQATGGFKLQAF